MKTEAALEVANQGVSVFVIEPMFSFVRASRCIAFLIADPETQVKICQSTNMYVHRNHFQPHTYEQLYLPTSSYLRGIKLLFVDFIDWFFF